MRRGEVVWVDFDPAKGSEARKRRPAVVVSNDGANSAAERLRAGALIVVPLTSNTERILKFQVLLPALAPLIDVFLVYGIVALDPIATIKLWLALLAIQMLAGLLAFAMERENPLALLWMPLQQLAYRQLMYGVLIKSLGTALAGVDLEAADLRPRLRVRHRAPRNADRGSADALRAL